MTETRCLIAIVGGVDLDEAALIILDDVRMVSSPYPRLRVAEDLALGDSGKRFNRPLPAIVVPVAIEVGEVP